MWTEYSAWMSWKCTPSPGGKSKGTPDPKSCTLSPPPHVGANFSTMKPFYETSDEAIQVETGNDLIPLKNLKKFQLNLSKYLVQKCSSTILANVVSGPGGIHTRALHSSGGSTCLHRSHQQPEKAKQCAVLYLWDDPGLLQQVLLHFGAFDHSVLVEMDVDVFAEPRRIVIPDCLRVAECWNGIFKTRQWTTNRMWAK